MRASRSLLLPLLPTDTAMPLNFPESPDLPDFTEKELTSTHVYRGSFLQVYRDEVRLPDGRTTVREYVRHPGAVMMVPVLNDGRVLLVRQFRYPHRRHFIEIPAGKIDPGEAPLDTGKRELREECGYTACRWDHLMTIHPCIGYSDEHIELYLARDLQHVGHALDEEEFLEVLAVPLDEAIAWTRSGRITEVKAVIGLTLARDALRGG
jgi:ADP-ribose pyrophosphatase